MLKRIFSLICALLIMLSVVPANAAEDNRSNVYCYILNDYLLSYGVISTEERGGMISDDVPVFPSGVVYADLVDFDQNGDPYLAIYCVDAYADSAECHIWKYHGGTFAEKVGVIQHKFQLGRYDTGVFSQGIAGNGVNVISYREFNSDTPEVNEFYTVKDSNILAYLKEPDGLTETGVMDYNRYKLHPGIDVSNWNAQLGVFFNSMKKKSMDSISYENIADRLSKSDKSALTAAAMQLLPLRSYTLGDKVENVSEPEPVTEILGVYDLGDEYYYTLYSTATAKYNDALMRRDKKGEYQVLKLKSDCIPMSDGEIGRIKTEMAADPAVNPGAENRLELSEQQYTQEPEEVGKERESAAVNPLAIATVVCGVAGLGMMAWIWIYLKRK